MKWIVAATLFTTLCASAQGLEDCRKHKRYGRLAEAKSCFAALTRSPNQGIRAEALWGIGDLKNANLAFRAAAAASNINPDIRVRWGRMYLEADQSGDAGDLFQEALKIKPNYPPALVGMALVASDHFEEKATNFAAEALKADPKLVEAQELLARLALEDSNPTKAREEADKALAMSPEALDAMAVHAAIDELDDKKPSPWFEKIFKINPKYGEAHGLVGHILVLNRRYEEGMWHYGRALALNSELWNVRAQLGVNLMRQGREEEARKELEYCYNNERRGNATINSLRLLDSFKNYETIRTPRTIIRVQKKEADLVGPYAQTELDRAMATYEKKYKVKLNAPVQVEFYPNHDDFAVRTMGMPGLGALGVTFGHSVAMDSPSGRTPGSFHWASTLWHELSHVYVLAVTNHRAPRWFVEGVAVHEETATEPDWGDRLDPQAIKAIKDKKLLPIATLDRGFIRPSYPSQVVVSYFQAGQICDFITEKWGFDKILGMMQAYKTRVSTPDVIEQQLGVKAEEFDKQFLAWLDGRTKTQVSRFEDWQIGMKKLGGYAEAKQWDELIKQATLVRDWYPDFVEHGSAYERLADAYAAKGDKGKAIEELQRYSKIGGRDPATIKKLAGWLTEQNQKAQAAAALKRLNFVYLHDEELHSKLGGLYMDLGDGPGAVREFEALVASKPVDAAGARFRLAQAYKQVNRVEDAKDQVLQALEVAPGYRPAQKLLLELNRTN